MADREEHGAQTKLETGPYIVRSLVKDVALSAAGDDDGVRITCVEVWKENLYVGTSAGEILHHVQIPPDPSDPPGTPAQWILASRLTPRVNQQSNGGIQQMLLLPSVSKALVLSSSTLTFYTLPELSPAFPQTKPLTCTWIGGVDLNSAYEKGEEKGSVAIMMCLRNKIRLVNIGEQAVRERDIEVGGCLQTVRRGGIACVADGREYALVDLVGRAKIPLLPISSLDRPSEDASQGADPEDVWPSVGGTHSRNASTASKTDRLDVGARGHSRSTSLGIFRTESPLGDSPRNSLSSRHGFDVPSMFNRQTSPRPSQEERRGSLPPDVAKPLPATPENESRASPVLLAKAPAVLNPVITSPSENEFLLVTGTAPDEPGLGMFVNLDGEIVRGTMEFSSFPESMVADGTGIDLSVSMSQIVSEEPPQEGYVLAVVKKNGERDIEVQRWDVDPGSGGRKEWLGMIGHKDLGIRRVVEDVNFELHEVVDALAQKAIRLSSQTPSSTPSDKGNSREKEERAYFQRMSKSSTAIVTWNTSEVYWTLRNPLVLKLDARLRAAERFSSDLHSPISPRRTEVEALINDLRGHPSSTELEFYTLSYIRQKAALLLFIDLILQTANNNLAFEHDKRTTEEALIESEIDPRFVVHFLPSISNELLTADEGVWVQGGVRTLMQSFMKQYGSVVLNTNTRGPFGDNLLQVVKRYLLVWRRKRGNPSVVDGEHVFPSVDAALLRILLVLDEDTPPGPANAGGVRAELNNVVDGGVECFDRAVQLLERSQRLYVLSRLYQSKKNASKVLETWRRIISGEPDAGGEFNADGEMELKTYLTKLRNKALVEEYGTWLAARNPKLGVQVFADDTSKITWTPATALAILREKAPAAVKEYLEYLVFSKKQSQHINELIAYYLDNVVHELESPSGTARETLRATYETYRALEMPKPTYRHFIEDNSISEEWWDSRLRLLQLLGETQGEGAGYDVDLVLERLGPYEDALVPEMIILNGRQGHHDKAIRLLTHGLGDFDMAISYCLRGGYSSPPSHTTSTPATPQSVHDQQKQLFSTVLTAFLSLPDLTYRIERTSELLERFGPWFEVEHVLAVIPTEWSIEILGPFLTGALGRLVRERNESRVVRALWGSENIRESERRVGIVEKMAPVVEREDGLTRLV